MFWTIIAIIILFLFGILGNKKPGLALISLPIVCICFAVSICIKEQPNDEFSLTFFFLIPIIIFVTLLAVITSQKEDEPTKWPHKIAKWVLLGIMIIIILSAGIALAGIFPPLGIWCIALAIVIVAMIYHFALMSHRSTVAYVLSTIGASMNQNLPLPMGLETAAKGRKNKAERTLKGIKKWLVEGYSLSEALKRGYPKCPGYAAAMIEAAQKINQLPQAFGAIEADMLAQSDDDKRVQPIHPFYPVFLICLIVLLVWYQMTFVMPSLGVMLDKMVGVALPLSTRILMNLAEAIRTMQPVIVAGMLFIIFGLIPYSLYVRFRPRRAGKPYLTSRAGDFMKWHLPILHWFAKNRSMVFVTEFLRLSLNAGNTVNEAIGNSGKLDVNNCFRKRLTEWLVKVESGEDISAAARGSGLGRTIAWAFDQKANPDNTITILRMLEKFYRSNYNYYVNLARFILWPCLIIMIGLIVGFVVYGFFSPYVLMLSKLCDIIP